MKTLILMRHAKSSWKDSSLADKERPLNKKGEKDAPRMGKLLKHEDLLPNLILSSTAVRAAKTAELVAEKCGYKEEIQYLDPLYLAEPQVILNAIKKVPADVKRLLVVGHNPGLEGMLQILSGKVESMPTASIAVIKIDLETWKELKLETEGKLKELWKPRDL